MIASEIRLTEINLPIISLQKGHTTGKRSEVDSSCEFPTLANSINKCATKIKSYVHKVIST